MDDLARQKLIYANVLERMFRKEEAQLRRWLNANVMDPEAKKWYLEQLRAEQAAGGGAV